MSELKYTPDVLPETKLFTSRPVLFIVNRIRYAGYYHENGFFYVSEDKKYEKPIFYAKHPKTNPTPFGMQNLNDVADISSWEYI